MKFIKVTSGGEDTWINPSTVIALSEFTSRGADYTQLVYGETLPDGTQTVLDIVGHVAADLAQEIEECLDPAPLQEKIKSLQAELTLMELDKDTVSKLAYRLKLGPAYTRGDMLVAVDALVGTPLGNPLGNPHAEKDLQSLKQLLGINLNCMQSHATTKINNLMDDSAKLRRIQDVIE